MTGGTEPKVSADAPEVPENAGRDSRMVVLVSDADTLASRGALRRLLAAGVLVQLYTSSAGGVLDVTELVPSDFYARGDVSQKGRTQELTPFDPRAGGRRQAQWKQEVRRNGRR